MVPQKLNAELQDRIRRSVKIDANDCWLWQRHKNQNGYGQIYISRATDFLMLSSKCPNMSAHRVSFEAHKGKISPGLQIDHLCKVRACVNPDHLEQVTPKENVRRSEGFSKQLARRTHCPQGHEYNEKNTYRHTIPNGSVTRSCYTCMLARTRVRNAKALIRRFLGRHTYLLFAGGKA